MERLSPSSRAYVSWEEVAVSNNKGRREIHYYLHRSDGVSDLAVIGKEKSARHLCYRYVIKNRFLIDFSRQEKLRSRREVIEWLNSAVSLSGQKTHESPSPNGGMLKSKGSCELKVEKLKDAPFLKLGHRTKEFKWVGSSWLCKKKRKHYGSFCRNGVNVSVHDFVFVLAEEGKRHVAYLEDMYEDSRGSKMVVVRWFHKVDEVGIVLHHNFNDREILFSLCLQDISIECIDGLATVLSHQHYEKFLSEARHTQLDPFVCYSFFEDDDVRPFDITQVKGYWRQEILRYMHIINPLKPIATREQSDGGLQVGEDIDDDATRIQPRKRLCQLKDDEGYSKCMKKKQSTFAIYVDGGNSTNIGFHCRTATEMCGRRAGLSTAFVSRKETKQNHHFQRLLVGSKVEVLSQDSGLRGCWFRALIVKKNKDKVKVQYQDIQDADDDANKLEEWVLASRVAASDELGVRISGRTTLRPSPLPTKGKISWVIDVGTAVDVWWHDGWWEGIVVQKDSEDQLHVYFPGEKRKAIFGLDELRRSQEWLGNGWGHVRERPDLVPYVLSLSASEKAEVISCGDKIAYACEDHGREPCRDESGPGESQLNTGNEKVKDSGVSSNSPKDLLTQWKRKSSRKRRRGSGSPVRRLFFSDNRTISDQKITQSSGCERFTIPMSFKVDHDNCKSIGDSLFNPSAVPTLTNLVMSR